MTRCYQLTCHQPRARFQLSTLMSAKFLKSQEDEIFCTVTPQPSLSTRSWKREFSANQLSEGHYIRPLMENVVNWLFITRECYVRASFIWLLRHKYI